MTSSCLQQMSAAILACSWIWSPALRETGGSISSILTPRRRKATASCSTVGFWASFRRGCCPAGGTRPGRSRSTSAWCRTPVSRPLVMSTGAGHGPGPPFRPLTGGFTSQKHLPCRQGLSVEDWYYQPWCSDVTGPSPSVRRGTAGQAASRVCRARLWTTPLGAPLCPLGRRRASASA